MSGGKQNFNGGAWRPSHAGNVTGATPVTMLNKPLRTACYKLLQEDIDKRKAEKAGGGASQPGDRRRITKSKTMRHTDDQVKACIRERRAGATFQALAEKYDTNPDVVRNWCSGLNRSHLLDAVEAEERAAAKGKRA